MYCNIGLFCMLIIILFSVSIQNCDIDIDVEMLEVTQSEPFLLVTGIPGADNCQVFVCCEKEIFLESKSIKDSLLDLIATYFVFDICYPKVLNAILIFFQHFVINLPDQQPVPSTVTKLVRNLQKVEENQ